MFLKYNYPGITWAVFILIVLGIPGDQLSNRSFLQIPYLDKIIHMVLFLILVFLISRGFFLQHQFTFLPDFVNASPKNIFQKISSKNISNDSCFFVRSIVFTMVLPIAGARCSVSCEFNTL